ncbi:DUF3515 domain-containing protein [Corynebacterium felinum]
MGWTVVVKVLDLCLMRDSVSGELSFNKTPIVIALVLGVLLVIGTLVGAKVAYNRAALQPVSMATLDTPDAQSVECKEFIAALPNKVLGHPRAELVDPAPAGAAAWRSSSTQQVTLRCGVQLPLQFSALSTLRDDAGTAWLTIKDVTPSSTMQTWYAVHKEKVVAVTTDAEGLAGADSPVTDLGSALMVLKETEHQPHPVPLTELVADKSERCDALVKHLPEQISEYQRSLISLDKGMAAWVAEGLEPIVLRCGVAFPESYTPGVKVTQVDDVVWFEDTIVGNGTTASYWYALGRDAGVVVSMPQAVGNSALVVLGEVMSAHTAASDSQ